MKSLSHFPSVEVVKVDTHAERDSFSCAKDFALALLPITIGVAFILLREYRAISFTHGAEFFTGHMKAILEGDRSLLYRLFTYGMFLLGLGSTLVLLHGVRNLEDADERRLRANRPELR